MEALYPEFRRKLDDVLRRRDPAALQAFLIAEGQWTPDTTTDPERAMWMMIATSPALHDLHDSAVRWLAEHGYTEEARVLGNKGSGGAPHRRTPKSGHPGRRPRPGPRGPPR